MAITFRSNNTGNLDMPKKSIRIFPLLERLNLVSKEKKKNRCAEVAKNKSSTCEIVKKGKRNCANFSVTPQNAKAARTQLK